MKTNAHGNIATSCWLKSLALSAVFALPLAAQENPFRISVGASYRADADIDNGGEFDEKRFGITLTRGFDVNEKLRFDPALSYRFSAYDFSRTDPWDDIHMLRFTLLSRYALNDQWSIFAGPSIGLAGESDADAEDAFTVGGAAGATYRFHERLAVGAGFTASSELEDDVRVRPLVIVNWQLNDRLSLETGYMEVAGIGGPGGEIRYAVNDQWSIGAGAQFVEKRFRLSDDARVREGVGEDSSIPVYAKIVWQPCANAAFELVGGVQTRGELQLDDRRGHEVFDEDYDPAPLVGLRAVLSF